MCGRFALRVPAEDLASFFGVAEGIDWQARYNIAPTQAIPVVGVGAKGRSLALLRWGLVPSWAETAGGRPLINARSESVFDKPSFRTPARTRRCLIPASGYYEWRPNPTPKQAFYFERNDEDILVFAGLWDQWSAPDGTRIASCTVLTTQANEDCSGVHHRMPVILKNTDHNLWMDHSQQNTERLHALLRPADPGILRATPVSARVNNTRHDDPACLEPEPI